MIYEPNIYINNQDNSCRFALGVSGPRPLYVIGLNPSIADDKIPDQTIKKVLTFSKLNSFDGFVMLNLYPKRTPEPNNLDINFNEVLFEENLRQIFILIQNSTSISVLAAWGENILIRDYLIECLKRIKDVLSMRSVEWLKIGELTKSGHPRHPSRPPYSSGFTNFLISDYLNNFKLK